MMISFANVFVGKSIMNCEKTKPCQPAEGDGTFGLYKFWGCHHRVQSAQSEWNVCRSSPDVSTILSIMPLSLHSNQCNQYSISLCTRENYVRTTEPLVKATKATITFNSRNGGFFGRRPRDSIQRPLAHDIAVDGWSADLAICFDYLISYRYCFRWYFGFLMILPFSNLDIPVCWVVLPGEEWF